MRRKATIAVQRMIFFAGALIIGIAFFAGVYWGFLTPSIETIPQLKASLTAHTIAIYLSSLSSMQSGEIVKVLDGTFDVEIGKFGGGARLKTKSALSTYYVTVTYYDENGKQLAKSERVSFVGNLDIECKDERNLIGKAFGASVSCAKFEKLKIISLSKKSGDGGVSISGSGKEGLTQQLKKQVLMSMGNGYGGSKTAYQYLKEKRYSNEDALKKAKTIMEHSSQRKGVLYIVLHHTGGDNAISALEHWSNPNTQASAHYLVDKDGGIIYCVPEGKAAWHAGCKEGEEGCLIPNMNSISIGIEIVNTGKCKTKDEKEGCEEPEDPYPQKQIEAVNNLVNYLIEKYNIDPEKNIIGHGCVTSNKEDEPVGFKPNENWGWKLAKREDGNCPTKEEVAQQLKKLQGAEA